VRCVGARSPIAGTTGARPRSGGRGHGFGFGSFGVFSLVTPCRGLILRWECEVPVTFVCYLDFAVTASHFHPYPNPNHFHECNHRLNAAENSDGD